MIFEKFIQLKTDRTVAAMIGMSRAKFDQLTLLFSDACQEIQRERLQRKDIKRLPTGGIEPYSIATRSACSLFSST
jgi:hypothetical protein